MRDFLHGWRRKVGCVALMMACVFAAGWMRSRLLEDEIALPSVAIIGPTTRWIISTDNTIQYWELPDEMYTSLSPVESAMVFSIPYTYITIPLTILSACLILWKPRKRKAESDG